MNFGRIVTCSLISLGAILGFSISHLDMLKDNRYGFRYTFKEKEEAYIKMIEQINENMKKGDLTQVVKLFPSTKSSYPTKKEYEEKLKKLKLI